MARAKRPVIRSMIIRLDEATMDALGGAADQAGLSREGFVRQLIESQLGMRTLRTHRIEAQRVHRDRYGNDVVDRRVKRRAK